MILLKVKLRPPEIIFESKLTFLLNSVLALLEKSELTVRIKQVKQLLK